MTVTLIVADGLQLAALGAYGNDWLPTPNLDRLAADSVVFDAHFADVPIVGWQRNACEMPSVKISYQHYADIPSGKPASVTTVLSDLRVIELPSLLPPWEESEFLVAAFEDWEFEVPPTEDLLNPQPRFLDPNDDAAWDELRRTYGVMVKLFDIRLGETLDRLQDSRELDESVLIVTTGRGQNLGEHGLVGDFRPWLHEEMVHLPLIVRLPGKEQAGRRVSHLTQTVDIPATILDALGTAKPDGWHGHSLLPMCRGGGPLRPYACMVWQIGQAIEYALQTPEEKVIFPATVPAGDPPRGPMYFVKPDDRWEVNNLRQQNLDRAEELEQALRAACGIAE